MKSKILLFIAILGLLAGCAGNNSATGRHGQALPEVTKPNGHSPASDNVAHAPMNDTDELRSGFNHGDGVLYVSLPKNGEFIVAAGHEEADGSYRIKMPWWRAIPG